MSSWFLEFKKISCSATSTSAELCSSPPVVCSAVKHERLHFQASLLQSCEDQVDQSEWRYCSSDVEPQWACYSLLLLWGRSSDHQLSFNFDVSQRSGGCFAVTFNGGFKQQQAVTSGWIRVLLAQPKHWSVNPKMFSVVNKWMRWCTVVKRDPESVMPLNINTEYKILCNMCSVWNMVQCNTYFFSKANILK